MSVKIEASGRRSVEDEFEVAGTPDEVWQAIASGPGISAWFVPTEIEERDGTPVAVKYMFGPGMEPQSEVTVWDPPRTFRQEADGWFPGSPRMASEWTIEARAGGTCTIRIVHSLFASTTTGTTSWKARSRGGPASWRRCACTLRTSAASARRWRNCATPRRAGCGDLGCADAALGLREARVGQRFATSAGRRRFSGVVEYLSEDPYDALLRIDAPAPGIVALGIAGSPGSGERKVGMNLYLYGDRGRRDARARGAALGKRGLQERWPRWSPRRTTAAEMQGLPGRKLYSGPELGSATSSRSFFCACEISTRHRRAWSAGMPWVRRSTRLRCAVLLLRFPPAACWGSSPGISMRSSSIEL
jgi:hypothetical protein